MKLVMVASLLVLASMSGAKASTVDFSSNNGLALSHGDFVDGRFDFGDGLTGTVSTIRNTRNGPVSGTAQVFDTNASNTEDPDLEDPTPFGGGASTDLGNVLIVNENVRRVDDNARGGVIRFAFDTVVRFLGVTLIDLETNQSVSIGADGYAVSGLSNADNEYSFFEADVTTRSLTFTLLGSGAIDNLRLEEVPLPAPAFLLLGGIGALGLMRRRKRV